jgi:hypothetical protein
MTTAVATTVRESLAISLDVDDLVEARRLAKELNPYFGVAKIGMELFSAVGPDIVGIIADQCCVPAWKAFRKGLPRQASRLLLRSLSPLSRVTKRHRRMFSRTVFVRQWKADAKASSARPATCVKPVSSPPVFRWSSRASAPTALRKTSTRPLPPLRPPSTQVQISWCSAEPLPVQKTA